MPVQIQFAVRRRDELEQRASRTWCVEVIGQRVHRLDQQRFRRLGQGRRTGLFAFKPIRKIPDTPHRFGRRLERVAGQVQLLAIVR